MALDFLAGCVGGCAGVLVGHPLDTIKVRLQTQDAFNPKYRGTWHCLTDTVKKESVRGLYKGMSSPIAGVSAINAIIFGVYGNVTKRFDDPGSLRSCVAGGAVAGFVQAFIAAPVELAKTRMQIQPSGPGQALYSGPLDCIKKIARKEGIRGVFRGQGVTLLREVPGFTTYFYSYECLSRKFSGNDGPSAPVVLMSGGIAGTASWVATYPIDVVKSRIQADGMTGTSQYKGMVDCFRKSIKTEGWSCMTRGLTSTICRSFPSNAATFYAVSSVTKMFETDSMAQEDSYAWKEVLKRGEIILSAPGPHITRGKEIFKNQMRSVRLLKVNFHDFACGFEDDWETEAKMD